MAKTERTYAARPQYEIDYSLAESAANREESAAHKAWCAEVDANPELSDEEVDAKTAEISAKFNAIRAELKAVYRAAWTAAGNTI